MFEIELTICIKIYLALNTLQRLKCQTTKPNQTSVDLGVMAMKGFSAFPKAHPQWFNVISKTLVVGEVLPLCRDAVNILYCPSRQDCLSPNDSEASLIFRTLLSNSANLNTAVVSIASILPLISSSSSLL